MKSIYQLTVLLATLVVLRSSSCIKSERKCDLVEDINRSSSVQVTFKDGTTGKYLYEDSPFTLYNKDSLKIFDENGNSHIILSAKRSDPITNIGYWELSFGFIYNFQTDASSFNTELCKNYIVKYKYNETDTIKVCFKAVRTECGALFDPIKVYHKGQLRGTENRTAYLLVTVIKQ